MSTNLLTKYVWLVDTIYKNEYISYDEINKKWLADDISEGLEIPKRTFHTWIREAEEMFGLIIHCERKGGYKYYIENADDIKEGGLRNWLLNTISVSHLMMENKQLKDRILLEYVPSGQEHLQTIIEAMKGGVLLNIIYHSYWRDEDTSFDVMPLCIKLFKQRWYMVGQSHGPRIYALDRIKSITKTEKTFRMPKDWKAEEFFDGCFGIIVDNNIAKQTVKLKASAGQANYIRDLRLHESQEEVERNEEYSIFTYFLRPTYDFQQELLWNGEDIEVLEPAWLRKEMAGKIKKMLSRYMRIFPRTR
jgi:hypothetical protein